MHKTGTLFIILLLFIQTSCHKHAGQEKEKPAAVTNDLLAAGATITAEAQAVLAKNLTGAINAGGAAHALAFCNTNAIPLTDSMAGILNAKLKRVTDKPRNPINLVSADELNYMAGMREEIAKGEKPKPQLVNLPGGKHISYYPIMTNDHCLQCHGKEEENIKKATLEKIKALYPADRATGYLANELRGLWVVEMNQTGDEILP